MTTILIMFFMGYVGVNNCSKKSRKGCRKDTGAVVERSRGCTKVSPVKAEKQLSLHQDASSGANDNDSLLGDPGNGTH